MSDSTPATTERKTYQGNCHCQAIKFTVNIPPVETLYTCNCSQCSFVSARFVPYTDADITFEKGKDLIVDYRFGNKTSPYQFCPKCGNTIGFYTPEFRAINARTFNDFDLTKPGHFQFDGAKKPPTYEPHPYAGPALKTEGDEKVFTGGCHCGNITSAFVAADLSKLMVVECDCSICQRNGHRSAYFTADKAQIHAADPAAQITYEFGGKQMQWIACSKCGVQVGGRIKPVPAAALAHMSPEQVAFANMFAGKTAINFNVIQGVNFDEIKVQKFSNKDREPKYVVA